jgi:hypothetical protein
MLFRLIILSAGPLRLSQNRRFPLRVVQLIHYLQFGSIHRHKGDLGDPVTGLTVKSLSPPFSRIIWISPV